MTQEDDLWIEALFIGSNGDTIRGEISAKAVVAMIENGGVSPVAEINMRIEEKMKKRMDALEIETIFIKVYSSN